MSEIKTVEVISPVERIVQAVGQGADLDKLERLLHLQRQWDEDQSKKVFYKEFAAAQAEIGNVHKSKTNNQTNSSYEELADILEVTKPIYTQHGFAVIFSEGKSDLADHVRITAEVLHEAGFSRPYFIDIPFEREGIKGNVNMTKTHAKGSALTYGRRYLMRMIWNVSTSDDDGNAAGTKFINQWQIEELQKMMGEKELEEGPLLKYLKVDSLSKIPEIDYKKAEAAIKIAKKGAK